MASQGAIGWLNNLHRGRDAGGAWAWLIDVSGVILTLLSVKGLGLPAYLKELRVSALLTMVGGCALTILLIKLAG